MNTPECFDEFLNNYGDVLFTKEQAIKFSERLLRIAIEQTQDANDKALLMNAYQSWSDFTFEVEGELDNIMDELYVARLTPRDIVNYINSNLNSIR